MTVIDSPILTGNREALYVAHTEWSSQANVPKQLLGISDDYYTAIPPDPSDAELDAGRAFLRELLTT